jgi:hypothetical protein
MAFVGGIGGDGPVLYFPAGTSRGLAIGMPAVGVLSVEQELPAFLFFFFCQGIRLLAERCQGQGRDQGDKKRFHQDFFNERI